MPLRSSVLPLLLDISPIQVVLELREGGAAVTLLYGGVVRHSVARYDRNCPTVHHSARCRITNSFLHALKYGTAQLWMKRFIHRAGSEAPEGNGAGFSLFLAEHVHAHVHAHVSRVGSWEHESAPLRAERGRELVGPIQNAPPVLELRGTARHISSHLGTSRHISGRISESRPVIHQPAGCARAPDRRCGTLSRTSLRLTQHSFTRNGPRVTCVIRCIL